MHTGMGNFIAVSRVFLICLGLLQSPTSLAQSDANGDDGKDEQAVTLERFSVTGYHLKRTDLEGPAPRNTCLRPS
jgi:hypothetical protein